MVNLFQVGNTQSQFSAAAICEAADKTSSSLRPGKLHPSCGQLFGSRDQTEALLPASFGFNLLQLDGVHRDRIVPRA